MIEADLGQAGLGLVAARHQPVEQAHAETRGALAGQRQVARGPGDAGDVEMRPGHVADELLQEDGTGGAARLAAPPDILDVGDVGLDVLLVGLAERQPPQQLAGLLGRRQQLAGQRLVIAEQARLLVPQRHDHGAGQRRQIDDRLGLESLLGVVEHVRQQQAALGVRVDHLDGRAGHAA